MIGLPAETRTNGDRVMSPRLGAFPTLTAVKLRRRSMRNLLRIGHCAPTVMQTVLDASHSEAEWLVRLTGAFPEGSATREASAAV